VDTPVRCLTRRAIGYAILCGAAVKILAGSGGGGSDPDNAVALDGALAELAKAPHGPVLLGIVAAGLIGFGAFALVESRYRRV